MYQLNPIDLPNTKAHSVFHSKSKRLHSSCTDLSIDYKNTLCNTAELAASRSANACFCINIQRQMLALWLNSRPPGGLDLQVEEFGATRRVDLPESIYFQCLIYLHQAVYPSLARPGGRAPQEDHQAYGSATGMIRWSTTWRSSPPGGPPRLFFMFFERIQSGRFTARNYSLN